MNLISITFIIFFIITFLMYWFIPNEFKNLLLVIASLIFYVWGDWSNIFVLFSSILITWSSAVLIKKSKNQTIRRNLLMVSCVCVLLILVYFKYFNGKKYNVIGVSIFTFHALSLLLDSYRNDIEKISFQNVLLYISFFPQILSGPIGKAKCQMGEFLKEKQFDISDLKYGVLQMLYGVFLKLVVAERIAMFVNNVYENFETAGQVALIAAVFLYSLQIYCDFAGYSLIAIGCAKTLGIKLPDNFKQPYLATSLYEFWKRWHISLTSWFRDYLYYPLGGNRKGKIRTYINILIVFVASGIWHGTGINFLIWGLLHGCMQIGERISRVKLNSKILTFVYVTFAWIFFRCNTFEQAFSIIRGIFVNYNQINFLEIFNYGLDISNWIVLIIGLLIVTITDILINRGVSLYHKIESQKLPIRWSIYYILIFSIIIFGIYGPGYDASNFIYYKF